MLKMITLSVQKLIIFMGCFLISNCLYGLDYYQPQINQQSHRATINQQPLWDGTYPQADGSTVWVRNGIATSNQKRLPVYNHRATTQRPRHDNRQSCVKLVQQSCGRHNECSKSQACELAMQMKQLKKDEDQFNIQQTAKYGKVMEKECQKSLNNINGFPRCHTIQLKNNNACKQLISKTCGLSRQCQDTRACDFAHQLLNLDKEERQSNFNPNAQTSTEQDCLKGMNDLKTFPSCR